MCPLFRYKIHLKYVEIFKIYLSITYIFIFDIWTLETLPPSFAKTAIPLFESLIFILETQIFFTLALRCPNLIATDVTVYYSYVYNSQKISPDALSTQPASKLRHTLLLSSMLPETYFPAERDSVPPPESAILSTAFWIWIVFSPSEIGVNVIFIFNNFFLFSKYII